LSGAWSNDRRLAANDIRNHLPRFGRDNLERNLRAVEALRGVAPRKGATVAQLAIAWVLARGDDIVPLVGARTRDRLTEALGTLEIDLGPKDLEAIEAAVPATAIAGTRCDAHQMSVLDS
jgi:aryl-alcohol dehydrogenase-like predicted oxidoreductase